MSLPSKGRRRILVDDVAYRWIVRDRPTYTQACLGGKMLAAVELDEAKGSILSIEFKWRRPDVAISSYPNSVTPKLVATCIKDAIDNGWDPSQAGPAFEYSCELEQHRIGKSKA